MAVLLGPVGPLELLWAEVAQRRVRPDPVVEALDVLEGLEGRALAALEGARVHAPGLDGAHERLHGGVVPGRRYRPHRRLDPGPPHRPAEQERGVLRAVVAVVHAALG